MQKVVLITGASSGLGLATALHLSEKGFNVFGTSRDPKKYKNDLNFDFLRIFDTILIKIDGFRVELAQFSLKILIFLDPCSDTSV